MPPEESAISLGGSTRAGDMAKDFTFGYGLTPLDITPESERPRGTRSFSEHTYPTEDTVFSTDEAEYLDDLLEGYNKHSRGFFVHVLRSGSRKTEFWVPVSDQFIQRHFKTAERTRLVEEGILVRTGYSKVAMKSREWRVSGHVMSEFAHALNGPIRQGYVDVNTGDPIPSPKPKKSRGYDANKNAYPEGIRAALKVLKTSFFNPAAVREHLQGLALVRDQAQVELEQAGAGPSGSPMSAERARRRLERAEGRLQNDVYCYSAIQSQGPNPIGGDIYCYSLAYTVQPFGRITQVGGAAQSCTREMKRVLYEGVPNVYNYDIKSSQAYILRSFLADAGFDTNWLDQYLKSDKKDYADRVGVSVDTWKSCLYAIIMGAALPPTYTLSKTGSVKGHITDDVKTDKEVWEGEDVAESLAEAPNPAEVYRRFTEVVGPLYKELNKWRKYLETIWFKEQEARPNRKGPFARNKTGMIIQWSDLEPLKPHKRRARLASFRLQGEEASFIHALTAILPAHGVTPISNEHDGIVTVGPIPDGVIERVKGDQKMPYVELVQKRF